MNEEIIEQQAEEIFKYREKGIEFLQNLNAAETDGDCSLAQEIETRWSNSTRNSSTRWKNSIVQPLVFGGLVLR